MAGELAITFLKELDANEDGEITEEEFVKVCLRNKSISDFLIDPFRRVMDNSYENSSSEDSDSD